MNQVAESVASLALAEAEDEIETGKQEIETGKQESDVEKQEDVVGAVEEDVIEAVQESKLGDTGVSSGFVKQALDGKEIVFVIGIPYSLS